MQLTHTFEIAAPVDQVFDVFGRLDLLAPCFPGASVWGRDGEVYHGAVKIKFGPFPLVFEGTARVVRADLAERRLVVKANARDRRGAAAGAATVTATFSANGADRTWVQVASDLDLTGRPAQLGSGAISSVSDRLADQFVGCIGAKLAAGLVADEPGAEEAAADQARPATRLPRRRRPAAPLRPEYAYRPPTTSESAPHLQVLPDVARTWLPWVGGAVGGARGAGARRPLAASALSPARGVRVSGRTRYEANVCVLLRRSGRWLLTVRAADVAYAPGMIGLVGGHVEPVVGAGRVRGDRATGSARGDRARPDGRAAALPVQ